MFRDGFGVEFEHAVIRCLKSIFLRLVCGARTQLRLRSQEGCEPRTRVRRRCERAAFSARIAPRQPQPDANAHPTPTASVPLRGTVIRRDSTSTNTRPARRRYWRHSGPEWLERGVSGEVVRAHSASISNTPCVLVKELDCACVTHAGSGP